MIVHPPFCIHSKRAVPSLLMFGSKNPNHSGAEDKHLTPNPLLLFGSGLCLELEVGHQSLARGIAAKDVSQISVPYEYVLWARPAKARR